MQLCSGSNQATVAVIPPLSLLSCSVFLCVGVAFVFFFQASYLRLTPTPRISCYLACCSYFLQMEERRRLETSWRTRRCFSEWKIICICVSTGIRDWLIGLVNCGWNRWRGHNIIQPSCLIIWTRVRTQRVLMLIDAQGGGGTRFDSGGGKKTDLKICTCIVCLKVSCPDERFGSSWVKQLFFHSELKQKEAFSINVPKNQMSPNWNALMDASELPPASKSAD